ncbi:MAG: CPBP family intramembrane metalloprotease [Phycisphaerales bacterium]|nr:CPBP family intramembrane metalloprotease [Phycisphaerales bacterium]
MNTNDPNANPFAINPPRLPDLPIEQSNPPARRPDPGSKRAALIAWIIFIVCSLTIAVQNQIEHFLPAQPAATPTAPAAAPTQAPIDPPDADPTSLTLRFTLKYVSYNAVESRKAMADLRKSAGKDPITTARLDLADAIIDSFTSPKDLSQTVTRLTDQANAQTDERLRSDLLLAAKVYSLQPSTTPPTPDSLNPTAVNNFRQRHGFLADATLGYADPTFAPARIKATSGIEIILILSLALVLGFIAAFLVGLGLLIYRLVTIDKPMPGPPQHLLPPLPGGSLPIEIAALFLTGFLAMRAIITIAAHAFSPETANLLAIILPWSLTALVLIYPTLRGIPFAHARQLLGLTAPRGITREISSGILGWLTAFPFLILALVISLVALFLIQTVTHSQPQQNTRILDLAAGAQGWSLILFLAMLTIWAPLTEELVFRGGLYRQLRTRLPIFLAIPISAFFFAIVHHYPLFFLTPVFTLGCLFAILRQHRTSLIASITAHALNNALAGIIILIMLNLLMS